MFIRRYDKNIMKSLGRSLEDYLETILILEIEHEHLRSTTIASRLGVSKPAVTKALKRLANAGLVTKNTYEDVIFTTEGRKLAEQIYYRHTTIKNFLLSLGIDKDTAEIDCCKIEHVISKKTLSAFAKQIKK